MYGELILYKISFSLWADLSCPESVTSHTFTTSYSELMDVFDFTLCDSGKVTSGASTLWKVE